MDRGLVVRLVAQACWFAFAFLALRIAVAVHALEDGRWGSVTVTWPELAAMALAFLGGLAATAVASRADREKP